MALVEKANLPAFALLLQHERPDRDADLSEGAVRRSSIIVRD